MKQIILKIKLKQLSNFKILNRREKQNDNSAKDSLIHSLQSELTNKNNTIEILQKENNKLHEELNKNHEEMNDPKSPFRQKIIKSEVERIEDKYNDDMSSLKRNLLNDFDGEKTKVLIYKYRLIIIIINN